MLHEFLRVIRTIGYASEFQSYCMSVQRTGDAGAPTVDEARKDYRAAELSRARIYRS